jgi:hypothetical protein
MAIGNADDGWAFVTNGMGDERNGFVFVMMRKKERRLADVDKKTTRCVSVG